MILSIGLVDNEKAYLLESVMTCWLPKLVENTLKLLQTFKRKLSMNLMMLPYVTPKRLWLMKLETLYRDERRESCCFLHGGF